MFMIQECIIFIPLICVLLHRMGKPNVAARFQLQNQSLATEALLSTKNGNQSGPSGVWQTTLKVDITEVEVPKGDETVKNTPALASTATVDRKDDSAINQINSNGKADRFEDIDPIEAKELELVAMRTVINYEAKVGRIPKMCRTLTSVMTLSLKTAII